jgi:hypothetical protein
LKRLWNNLNKKQVYEIKITKPENKNRGKTEKKQIRKTERETGVETNK